MAYSQDIKNKLRANYIKGMTMKAAASALSVPSETARTWKRKARELGDDWDHAKSAKRVSKGGAKELTSAVIEDFIETFASTIESLKKAENINPIDRARTLAQLSDAYQKTIKAMGDSNPSLSNYAVVMDVLQRLGEFCREHYPQLFGPFTEMLDQFAPELANVYAQ